MELWDIGMPSKQKFGDFILFEMYSPHIYILPVTLTWQVILPLQFLYMGFFQFITVVRSRGSGL